MKKEMNPKVNQLFTAVIDLIEEGMDIHTMKVIDITNRAGIGKGTAYEYFECKEELVVAALAWDMKEQFENLKKELQACMDFREQIFTVFHWMDCNKYRKRSGTQFFKMAGQSYEIAVGVKQEFQNMAKEKFCIFGDVMELLYRQGMKDGIIGNGQEISLIHMTMISSFITYFLYCTQEHYPAQTPPETIKEALYRNLCICLKGDLPKE
ncbi:MAG: TetR/AcrR family transcriptional regulator [Blautia sp.]